MAKTITVTTYPKPTNFTATLQSGGSLQPNTTYYVRIYACDGSERIQGEISDEISFTTTDTEKSALLSWDPVPGVGHYAVVQRTDAHPDYNYYGCFLRCPTNNSVYYTTTTNSFLFSSTSPYYYTIHPFVSPKNLPFGLNKNKGRGLIEVSGSTETDPCTADDLYNAIIGAKLSTDYYCYDDSTFAWLGSVRLVGGGNCFKCDSAHGGKTFFVLAGMFYYDGENNTIYIGDKLEDSDIYGLFDTTVHNYPEIMHLVLLPNTFMRPSYYAGYCDFYLTSVIFDGASNHKNDIAIALYQVLDYGGCHLDMVVVYTGGWSWSFRSAEVDLKNTFVGQTGQVAIYSSDNQLTGVTGNTFRNLDLFGCTDGMRIFKNKIYGVYDQKSHLRVKGYSQTDSALGSDGKIRFYLRDVELATVDNNIPYVQYYGADPSLVYPTIYCEATKKVRVVDINRNPISGANVSITNSAGWVWSGVTDASGVVELYPIFGATINDWNAYIYQRREEYAPLVITVKKKGYEDAVITLDSTHDAFYIKDILVTLVLPNYVVAEVKALVKNGGTL